MKIGIATIHHAKFSYGACLQAVAMVKLCQNFSDRVEIINYENIYEQTELKTKNVSFIKKIKQCANFYARMYLYDMRKNPYRDSSKLDSLYGCVTKKYHSVFELKDLQYDVLVCGSDQIWNPEIMGEIDPFFLLDFGKAKRRISYAASMGSYEINDREKILLSSYLKNFTAISVREEHAKRQLQSLTDKKIQVVSDPTLLLNRGDWEACFPDELSYKKKDSQKYILCFFVWSGISLYMEEVKKYAKELNLPIWNIQSHSKRTNGVDQVIQAPTVGEFLSLLDNAELIITNSFHGVAFSLNLNKKFIPILNMKNPERVKNLLDNLGLEQLINVEPKEVMNMIDYDQVNFRMQQLRDKSFQWLKNAIIG
ncbi:polysaccharide pyruvyl transferase family protein [Ruminococcus sp. OA3]|uniref:polysaccharide pyruvyl transferase family protein n=1 Tax=Ruminococcus sp. OA3 TaxID=2914164 RepID=UPI001F066441|nr:polysaccharide pyruvyl transferase family protein [Ruminococcus sp. OA3]MCH1982935.1 polysaccharide pyruvyl transferase family protein [Ruminococcus sp. OA3]